MSAVQGSERISVEEINNPANSLSELRARLRNYVAEPAEAGEPPEAETEDEEIPNSESEESSEEVEESDVEEESEESVESQPRTKQETSEDFIPRSKLKETDEWKSLSANMHRASQALQEANKRIAALESQSKESTEEKENQERLDKYNKAVAYIEARTPEGSPERKEALERLQDRLIREEMQRFGNWLLTEKQSVSDEKANIQLTQLRAKTPEYADSIADYVAEKAEASPASLKKLLASQPIKELFERTPDPIGTLETLGEVMYALALFDKEASSERKAQNRKKATEEQVHVKSMPAGAGIQRNVKNAEEQMGDIKPGQDWQDFRKEVRKKKSIRAALRGR